MRILYVITSLSVGGAETQLKRMAGYLATDKNNTILIIVMIKPEDFVEELNQLGVVVETLNMIRGKVDSKSIKRFLDLVREFKPDVIHSHMYHANVLCRFSRLFVKMPLLINTIHGAEGLLGKRSLIYRLTDPLCEVITAVGNVLAKRAIENRAVPRKKLQVIYNALETQKYKYSLNDRYNVRKELNIGERDFVWIFVGRLSDVKDHITMLAAFRQVSMKRKENKPILLLVGNGENRTAIERIIKHDNELDHVRLLGKRNDINQLLCSADAFVLSSIHEGLPLVLQEAASIGLPMVATDVGGCNELVINEKNGYIVPSKSPQKLADAMIKIMDLSVDQKNKFSEYSRKMVRDKFEISKIMNQWMCMYNKYYKKGM